MMVRLAFERDGYLAQPTWNQREFIDGMMF